MRKLFALAALGLMIAGPVAAMDIDAIKASQKPATNSLQEAEVCSSVFSSMAFIAEDKESEDAKRDTLLARLWVTIAAEKAGSTYDDYIDKNLIGNMQAFIGAVDVDIFNFYYAYCTTATQRVIDENK